MSVNTRRVKSLIDELEKLKLDGLFVSSLTNIRYLSGFTGSAARLVVLKDGQHFFSDTRYAEQSKKEVGGCAIHMIKKGYIETIAEQKIISEGLRLGIEATDMNLKTYRALLKAFPKVEWVETESVVEKIAAVKDETEISLLKKAAEITDKTFSEILNDISAGSRERDVAAKLSFLLKKYGADGDSFSPIVASGTHSALPHARPTDKVMAKGEFVVLDFGGVYQGYHADMTRTVAIGEADERMREVYGVVLEAQMAAIKAAKAGMTGHEVDKICRDYITAKGYANQFCHSTGHGIGLEVHTYPLIAITNNEPLLENYAITIEPGVYIPGWGGVRIEDDCYLTAEGCTLLTRSPKELTIL